MLFVDPPLFQAIAIETVNKCNRKCWFCKFGQLKVVEPYDLMSWNLIEKIVSNLVDLKFTGRVSWFKINEPLMDKRIVQIIHLTKQQLPECYCSLLSNGDLLNNEILCRLWEAGLDRMGVSIYDDQTLAKVSGLNDISKLKIIDRRQPQEEKFVENRGGNIELLFPKDYSKHNCLRPSTMLNIDPNGEAVLCCADFYKAVVVGSVYSQRLEEIWYNETLMKYRQQLANQGRIGLTLCQGCDHSGRGHHRNYP